MKKNGTSYKNSWGGYNHYDEHGNKIGESRKNFWGGYDNYDAKGNKTGSSTKNFWGGYTERDVRGNKVGESNPNFWNGYTHRDIHGNKIGESDPNFLGGYNTYGSSSRAGSNVNKSGYQNPSGSSGNTSGGCYIATCVYGSYDTPEVCTLRRFRDYKLAKTAVGRLFISIYYAISPQLVRYFGEKKCFRTVCRHLLDKMVSYLQSKGLSNKPYEDIKW